MMSDDNKIFLSYSHKNMDLANEIDNVIYKKGIRVTRDIRDVKCSQSFKEFMKSIGKHDIVLMLISDHYLKSQACMFEVIEAMKESDYKERIIPIVSEDVCFNLNGIKYLEYWEEKEELIEKVINEHLPEAIIPLEEERDEIRLIENNIMEFIATIRDLRYISFKELSKQYTSLYEAIGIEVVNASSDYEVVTEKNVGIGFVRRSSLNVLMDNAYPKCEIKEALKEIIFSLKPDNDVIWIFAYNKLDDIPKTNWFCKGYWVSSNLDQRWHPGKMKSNDQIEGIQIVWNDEYESRREVYKPHSGTKKELLEFADSLLKQVVPIAKAAIEKFDQFQNGKISEDEFLEYMQKNQLFMRELYSKSGERKFATYECGDYVQKFDNLFAIADNMFLYYSKENTNTWSSKTKKVMMKDEIGRFFKELEELHYERNKLK